MEAMQQIDDGSMVLVNPFDSVNDLHIGGPAPTSTGIPRKLVERVAVFALTASDTAGAIVSWVPGAPIIVTDVILHVKTIATAACTLDIGIAANGTTSAATLINGVDVHSATGVFDTVTDHGSSGKTRNVMTATQAITASKASGAAAGLVGFLYVHYYPAF